MRVYPLFDKLVLQQEKDSVVLVRLSLPSIALWSLQIPRDTIELISHATFFLIPAIDAYGKKPFHTSRNSSGRERH
jgi:hypothetical protein